MSPGKVSRRQFLGALFAGAVFPACATVPHGYEKGKAAAARPLRMVFYTDVHARTEWETPRALRKAAKAINAAEPDLVIGGGDLITDGLQSSAITVAPRWDAYLEMHQLIRAPHYVALGNHDLVAAAPEDGSPSSPDPRLTFREKMGLSRTYQSFDMEGYHFIILDSVQLTGDETYYRGWVEEEQMQWVKEDLAHVNRKTPVVLVSHLPLISGFYQATEGATYPAPSNRVVVNNREVLDLFVSHNLVLVLQGHLHVDEWIHWRGTSFITGGAVCAKWWRGTWYGTEEGFGVVTLDGNSVSWEYIDYGWQARRPPGK